MLSQHSTVLMQSVDNFFKVCPDGCFIWLLWFSLPYKRGAHPQLLSPYIYWKWTTSLCFVSGFIFYIQISTLDVCTFSSGSMGIAYLSRAGSSRIHPAGGNQRKSRWAEKKAIVFRSETWPPNQLPRANRTYWPRKKELILIAQQGTCLPRRWANTSFSFWWGLQVFLSFHLRLSSDLDLATLDFLCFFLVLIFLP